MSMLRYGSTDHPPEELPEPMPVIGESPSSCPQCGSSALSTVGSRVTGFETVCLGCRHTFRVGAMVRTGRLP